MLIHLTLKKIQRVSIFDIDFHVFPSVERPVQNSSKSLFRVTIRSIVENKSGQGLFHRVYVVSRYRLQIWHYIHFFSVVNICDFLKLLSANIDTELTISILKILYAMSHSTDGVIQIFRGQAIAVLVHKLGLINKFSSVLILLFHTGTTCFQVKVVS